MAIDSTKPSSSIIKSDYYKPENNSWMDLVCSVSKKVGSVPRVTQLLQQAINMTQKTLNTMAASILLFDNDEKELYFEVASGPVGKALKKVKISSDYGIAGQVVHTGKPLIVNDVTRHPNFHGNIDEVTGFETTSMICAPLIVHRKTLGVIEVINKNDGSDFNDLDLDAVITVAATIAMAIENAQLHQDLLNSYKATISALASAIDAKDPYTHGHSKRVKEYALMGGRALSLSAERMETLECASILHDMGKISIDASILNKPGALNSEEWEVMREHPMRGYELLQGIPFLKEVSEFVLYHHERYDGEGYPVGIKGDNIPIEARLIAVADAFDTMTTDRSYRSAMSFEEAVKSLYDCSGTQFCPEAIKAIVSSLSMNKEAS